jgi:acetyl-CoA C-acetyltransferase
MSGQHDLVIAGGAESMSRIGIGASGGAWPVDPQVALPSYFMPQGVSADLIATKYGFSRDDVDAYAVESQKRAANAWEKGYFGSSRSCRCKDINGLTILARDEHMRPETDMQSLASLNASFEIMGSMGGFDAVAIQAHPEVERIRHVHHAGNSSGIVDGAAAILIGSQGRPQGRAEAARTDQGLRQYRLRSGADADRPGRRHRKAAQASAKMSLKDIDLFEINEAFASVVLRYGQAFDLDPARSMSMAERLPWATRWAPPAR